MTGLPTHILLRVRRNINLSVEMVNARVVVGANFQVYEEGYIGNFAPVASF